MTFSSGEEAVAPKKAWAEAGKAGGASPPAKAEEAYPIIAERERAEPPIAWEGAKVGPPRPAASFPSGDPEALYQAYLTL